MVIKTLKISLALTAIIRIPTKIAIVCYIFSLLFSCQKPTSDEAKLLQTHIYPRNS